MSSDKKFRKTKSSRCKAEEGATTWQMISVASTLVEVVVVEEELAGELASSSLQCNRIITLVMDKAVEAVEEEEALSPEKSEARLKIRTEKINSGKSSNSL